MLISCATEFDVEVVNINVGEMYVAVQPAKIMTILGSCVSVCIWDTKLKLGGMNHYLLPHAAAKKPNNQDKCGCMTDFRYGCVSIETLLQRLYFAGAKKGKLAAKVFGGGEVMYNDGFKKPLGKSIGMNNVALAEGYLKEVGIPIVARDTGGKDARKIIFNTETGQVMVKRLHIGILEENVV